MGLSPTQPIRLGPQAILYARHLVETNSTERERNCDRDDSTDKVFSDLAIELGLTTRHRPDPGTRYFEIDFNQIIYLTDPTPERLYSLVKLATQIEQNESYGIHIGLLRATAYWGDLKDFASGKKEWIPWYSGAYATAREGSKLEDAEMRNYLRDVYRLTEGVPGSISDEVPADLIFHDEGTPVALKDYLEIHGYDLRNEVLLNSDIILVESKC